MAQTVWRDDLLGSAAARIIRGKVINKLGFWSSVILLVLGFFEHSEEANSEAGRVIRGLIEGFVLSYYWLIFALSMFFIWDSRKRWLRGATEPVWVIALGAVLLLNTIFLITAHVEGESRAVATTAGTIYVAKRMRLLANLTRIFYPIFFWQMLRKALWTVAQVLKSVWPIACITLCSFVAHFLIISAYVPGHIPAASEGAEIWNFCPAGNTWDAIWSLYICFTTANHPDLFMPLFHQVPWTAI